MILLIIFAFLAGIVTILSPCILPILPIVLSSSLTGGKKRPLGIVAGFIFSFTFFTLFLSIIVKATGISPDALRMFAVVVIATFGLTLIIPLFRLWMEKIFSRLAGISSGKPQRDGFTGGILVGLTLGLLWAPCVGPILASVISLALTGTVTGSAVLITLAYATGTAIPMLAITYGGRSLLAKTPWLTNSTATIQKIFGVLMIIAAGIIFFNLDRKFQTYILTTFPNYGTGLTRFEDNPLIQEQLDAIRNKPADDSTRGKPMYEIVEPGLGLAPEIIGGQQWFNSEPLTLAGLKGKVVLIDFWTYTCINCIRTFPYTKSWYEKYKDKGFVLIGVHTPEFEFEKDANNVERAIKDFGISYPVVQDNNYTIWNAYNNRYWPAHYLINKEGKIVDTHFGEGAYDETEKKIQELLDVTMPIDNPTYRVQTNTPETYLGNARGEYSNITTTGTWTRSDEYAMPSAGSTLTYNFDAANVYLVMRPKIKGTSGDIQVLLDGAVIGTVGSGEDVVQGVVTVDSDRLYRIIKLPTQGRHILQLKFLDGNLELYAFTFG